MQWGGAQRQYLPQVQLESHTTILSTTSRTTLKQIFVNSQDKKLDEVQYTFPLYDGVSVVGFKCTVADKVLVGVVKEKQQARKDYQEAIDRGETAGLLEQVPESSDAFTTKVGNVPAGERIHVEITYLGELKHDAETDGARFTIPTVIAPRYGSVSHDTDQSMNKVNANADGGIKITVDVGLEEGSVIRGLQSPSHPIAVSMGRTSTMDEDAFDNTHASATLTLGKTELDKDFIIVVQSKEQGTPRALLETHPTIPHQRALMITLVPKFNIPNIAPEIVFVVDRSGSMGGKIDTLVAALKIFLKSLPANGTKFNICSFGSHFDFLFKKSKTYDQSSLNEALQHLQSFSANYGGTEMLEPVKETCKNRYKDMPLEVMVLTDGQIWNQDDMFAFINDQKNARFFSLGIGHGASSALVEGIARAGNGFAQFVGENEKMDKRVVRMLKGALTPHISDYRLEVQYGAEADDDFEMVESATDSMKTVVSDTAKSSSLPKKVISLFDTSAKEEKPNPPDTDRFSGLPTIAVPKVLQAPHQIPALYPFNRTTVYLILGPESSQKTLQSVVLRGTSEHGPLELKIPVQDVGRGETIHQLAAKKAVHELEQGRGWITELKVDNKSLKNKYEGRWDLMVEREAVRLGVQFQVGGKYCSFVAVEKKDEGRMEDDKAEESFEIVADRPKAVQVEHARRSFGGALGYASKKPPAPGPGGSLFGAANFSSAPAPAASYSRQTSYSYMAPAGHSDSSLSFGAPSSSSVRGLSYSPQPIGSQGQQMGAPMQQQQSLQGYQVGQMTLDQEPAKNRNLMTRASESIFGSSVRRRSGGAPRGGSGGGPPPRKQLASKAASMNAPMKKEAVDRWTQDYDPTIEDSPMVMDALAEPFADEDDMKVIDDDRMHKLIEMQEFDGSWASTTALWDLIEVKKSEAEAAGASKDEKVMATLMAIAWLEVKMKSEEDVWEMVVEKAKIWLEGALGAGAVQKAMADARRVVAA